MQPKNLDITPADETREDELYRLYAAFTGLEVLKLSDSTHKPGKISRIDRVCREPVSLSVALRNEGKHRYNGIDTYNSLLLSLHKFEALLAYAQVTGVPSILLVRFTDVTAFWNVKPLLPAISKVQSPRGERGGKPDICVEIPVSELEVIPEIPGHGEWKRNSGQSLPYHVAYTPYGLRGRLRVPVDSVAGPQASRRYKRN